MAISGAVEAVRPSDEAGTKRDERRALGVACGAHILHDGYTDLVWVALPIWQTEFGLNYAAIGLLRTIYSGTLAGLQIPATALAGHIGAGTVLSAGTALEDAAAQRPPRVRGRRAAFSSLIDLPSYVAQCPKGAAST